MTRPLLQLALDQAEYAKADEAVDLLFNHVDIIEAGTILCLSCGMDAVRRIRARTGNKTLVVDMKITDAGEALAAMAFDNGADWTTVVCAAPVATIRKVAEIANLNHGEAQIELFGHWSFIDAAEWLRMGIRQVIFHRGRDAQAAGAGWSESDIDTMKKLSDMGMELSVTGGVAPDQLAVFSNIAVKCFIVGRGLYGNSDPVGAARQFNQAIQGIWD